ncbi:hypothetical protein Ddc_12365 [Ditylenchus destructor]|nr:hypothetical protein Ddc_12365 [Ditylenchus destructor]
MCFFRILNASDNSMNDPPFELYTKECKKISFTVSVNDNSDMEGKECEFSMSYGNCSQFVSWQHNTFIFTESYIHHFTNELGIELLNPVRAASHVYSSETDEIVGKAGKSAEVTMDEQFMHINNSERILRSHRKNKNQCNLTLIPKDDGWCMFTFAFKKIGNCDGSVLFDNHKLLAYTAPASGPWIIIISVFLLFISGILLCLGFWICFCQRRNASNWTAHFSQKSNSTEYSDSSQNMYAFLVDDELVTDPEEALQQTEIKKQNCKEVSIIKSQ